ncbi:DUF3995 domain-containing protein [Dyadobacter sp. MSC1_007]|jgi:hypothetical protein|uniref:DUF3995 domain-containing protein n=1 Tax=Dyadobacter sp. MSC1_007 TaxID=2909264 RepID=UPI002030D9A1|nr:DUF3995 domain-containing protein [Dyadobacter sp. MSC1_007]
MDPLYINILLGVNSIIFLSLSLLHVYWASGGQWAGGQVLPQMETRGDKVFIPGKGMTLSVAAGLLSFSILNAVNLYNQRSQPLFRYGLLALGLIFIVRVLGDFKYVGIAKCVRNTEFAQNDDRIFIPLCAYLALSSVVAYFF